ncbi:MAG: right-handed parallel beta-helix repeat-containing protein [Gemmatimonadetes bacterium]|nr:right-handed parallel beta-helix repeat-containing protein [Gemmatimonadota bacterium]
MASVPGPRTGTLALGVAFTLIAAAPAQAQILVGVSPTGISAVSGGTVTVPLVADLTGAASTTLGSYRLQLSWNPSVLGYAATAPGTFAGVPSLNTSNTGSGQLVLAAASASGATGTVVLAEVSFNVLADTGSTSLAVVVKEITAAQTFADLLPSTSSVPGLFCTNTGDYGDVNRNGSILSDDALAILTASVGLSIAPLTLVNGDVDADGKTNARDALIILSAAVGLPTNDFRIGLVNTGTCSIVPAASLSLTPNAVSLATGDVFPLQLVARDAAGRAVAAPGAAWSSGTPATATVDATGRVSAVSSGTTTVSAATFGGLSASTTITVGTRHTWYVAQSAQNAAVQLGSSAYPFGSIQQALNAAASGDTVQVGLGEYTGSAAISKPVVLIGDSTASGMPVLRNSSGPALGSNTTGRVVVQRLHLTESNVGLLARGDTIEVQSVRASVIRGPGFSIRGMGRATLDGVSAHSVMLAGVLVDSTTALSLANADFRLVGRAQDLTLLAADSERVAAAVIVLETDTARLSRVNVFGVEDGPGVFFGDVTAASASDFRFQFTNGVGADRVRAISLARGEILESGDEGSVVEIRADTAVLDSVLVHETRGGMRFEANEPDTTVIQHDAVVTITRSAVDSVQYSSGMRFERIGKVHIGRSRISFLGYGDGIVGRSLDSIQIDSTLISTLQFGTAVDIDPTALLSMRGTVIHRAIGGGIRADSVGIVSLVGVRIDSSAVPFFYGYTNFALQVSHADSVRLDSIMVTDNTGGGVVVDSSRVLTAVGGVVARNLGFGGYGYCEYGCYEGSPPIARTPASYSISNPPGMVLAAVETARIAHYALDSNSRGGVLLDMQADSGAFTIDSSRFTGPGVLLKIRGNPSPNGGDVLVRGSGFFHGSVPIDAYAFRRLTVQGTAFDSASNPYNASVQAQTVDTVRFQEDTVRSSWASGFQVNGAALVDVRTSVFRGLQPYYPTYYTWSAIDIGGVDSTVVYGNRIEGNRVRGVRLTGSATKFAVVDSNAVVDDTAFAALDLYRAARVTRNLIARDSIGVYLTSNAGSSLINNNSIAGNLVHGLRNLTVSAVNAQSNWWNDPLGPRCGGGTVTGCTTSGAGDLIYSTSGSVDATNFRTDGPPPDAAAVAPFPSLTENRR